MMSFAQTMFMAEAEGLLPTRAGKINAIIKKVKSYPALTIYLHTFENIVRECGIDPATLTEKEIKYINSAIK